MPDTGDAHPQAQKPTAAALQDAFERGMALHQQGRLADAERLYREVLQQQPNHFGAWHLLGVIAVQTRHTEQAVELIGKAIALKPDYAEAHYNRGLALMHLKRSGEALASYDTAIALKPDFAEAHCNRGNVLGDLKRSEEALASYDQAIALKPDYAEAHYNRGLALMQLKRPEEALASCDQAIALKPDYAEAHYNRALALLSLNRPKEALANYDRTIALKPDYAEAHCDRGLALLNLNRPAEALASYDEAIALKPDYAEAHCNRGNALRDLKRFEEALASHDKAIALKPELAEAWFGRGIVFHYLKRYDDAFHAYDKALTLRPDLTGAEGLQLYIKYHLCDWRNIDAEGAHLISSLRNGNANTPPFPILAITSSPADQLQCAKLWIANKFPPSETPIWHGERYQHDRIRVAYLSPHFREHPLAFLMSGIFECHDKSHFDIAAISIGPNDNSELHKQLKGSFERFIDAEKYPDDQLAHLVRELEIDILIDLAGFTEGLRTSVFAKRPAPIQVNYLGYPGTMGAEYIDYMIADRIVIPNSQLKFYAEKIVHLPNSYYPTSYQLNDSRRITAPQAFTRADMGLPQTAFVFCCFNNNYKITPDVFDGWMRILKRVDGSVLWLLEANASAASNLRKEAGARGVDPERLVFAKPMSLPDHLARHRLADLFLDTLPYNAHTTASDALWVGLPVLTRIGETFAGRVAASLLTAIGLPELITATPQAYEELAIELANNPEKLAAISQKLANNRLTTPLFDTKLFTQHIEAGYTAMYERYQAGLPPDHIYI